MQKKVKEEGTLIVLTYLCIFLLNNWLCSLTGTLMVQRQAHICY